MTRLAILLVPLFLLSASAPTLGVEKVPRQSDGLMETQRSVCEMSSECPDERNACEGTVYTFSCASDICNNGDGSECYICVSG